LAFSYTWDFVYTGVSMPKLIYTVLWFHRLTSPFLLFVPLCRNGIMQMQKFTLWYQKIKPTRGQPQVLFLAHLFFTARHHAALILNKNDSMAPDLQRSKTMVQAPPPRF
jgi:hypothetical protein